MIFTFWDFFFFGGAPDAQNRLFSELYSFIFSDFGGRNPVPEADFGFASLF